MRIKHIVTAILFSLGAWGCSENPGVAERGITSPNAGEDRFADQFNGVVATVTSENADRSELFQQSLATLIDQTDQGEVGVEASRVAGIDRARALGAEAASHLWRTIDGPAVITQPGLYRVTQDFSSAADGIVIESSWVLLWLGDHTLTGPGAKEGRGIVLRGVSHVAVIGGILENFGIGVVAEITDESLIRWVDVQGADEFADPGAGNPPQIGTMLVNSSYNKICANSFKDINLGIFVRGGGSMYNRILRNSVVGGDHGLLAICYNPAGGEGDAGPRFDEVKFNWLKRFGTGIVASKGSAYNRFTRNDICYFNSPYADLNGTNVFRHNTTNQIAPPGASALSLSFGGLENLGADYVYEGWLVVSGVPVSTGTFSVDDAGNLSQSTFWIASDVLAMASKFVLTIEPVPDPDPAPTATHYLAGDFLGSDASLTVADPAALGTNFLGSTGSFILETPSTASNHSDYAAGIWWLDPSAGPGASLQLPTLPPGWVFEGWVVGPGGPVTTGYFIHPAGADSDLGGPTAGADPTPPFPGQDFINPPMNLVGHAAVITIEPMPDNSPAPFTLKPLVDGNIEDVGAGVLQSMMNNAGSFPTGSAMR